MKRFSVTKNPIFAELLHWLELLNQLGQLCSGLFLLRRKLSRALKRRKDNQLIDDNDEMYEAYRDFIDDLPPGNFKPTFEQWLSGRNVPIIERKRKWHEKVPVIVAAALGGLATGGVISPTLASGLAALLDAVAKLFG